MFHRISSTGAWNPPGFHSLGHEQMPLSFRIIPPKISLHGIGSGYLLLKIRAAACLWHSAALLPNGQAVGWLGEGSSRHLPSPTSLLFFPQPSASMYQGAAPPNQQLWQTAPCCLQAGKLAHHVSPLNVPPGPTWTLASQCLHGEASPSPHWPSSTPHSLSFRSLTKTLHIHPAEHNATCSMSFV